MTDILDELDDPVREAATDLKPLLVVYRAMLGTPRLLQIVADIISDSGDSKTAEAVRSVADIA